MPTICPANYNIVINPTTADSTLVCIGSPQPANSTSTWNPFAGASVSANSAYCTHGSLVGNIRTAGPALVAQGVLNTTNTTTNQSSGLLLQTVQACIAPLGSY